MRSKPSIPTVGNSRSWSSYLLARETRDRNAACDRFMDKMSSLTDVFHNEAMSFDRETGKSKHFQAGSLYFKGAPSEDTRLDLWFPDNRRTEECVSAYASLYPLITYYLNWLPLLTLIKKPYREKGCKNRNSQPERIYGLAVSAE
jgi:hypothetical protein